jgi:hypothetical protein
MSFGFSHFADGSYSRISLDGGVSTQVTGTLTIFPIPPYYYKQHQH